MFPPRPPRSLPRLAVTGLLLAAGLMAAQAVRAQALGMLVDAALGYDATYLSARAQAEAAEFRAARADALKRPTVGLSASGTATEQQADAVGSGNSRVYSAGVRATHPLLNRANSASWEQAQRALAIAKADLVTAEQDLVVRVAQAYFDVLAAQDALAAAQAFKKAVSEQLASARRNFEVGTATITDTRESQARFDLATARELVADNDLRTKRTVLDQLVGRAAVAPRGLALPVQLPPVAPADMDEWVRQAEALHPGVRKAQLAQEVARFETEKARAAGAPTVDLVGTAGYSRSAGSAVQPAGRGNASSASIGVQLALPLYTGGAVGNGIREALSLEEKARQDLDAARRGMGLGTRSAYLGVQSLLGQVKALEAAEASTKLALDATELGYKVGVRVNLDVLNAQSQLFDTRRDLAKARYDVIVNGLKLRQASGQLMPGDVRAVDALLQP